MSIWGKLAAAELLVSGSIGGLLGGRTAPAHGRSSAADRPDNEVPFTVGVIVLGAKMAKADGSVSRDEVRAFKEAFQVSPAEMKQAARMFQLAKQDAGGYEAYADELVTLFKGNRKLLEDVLEGLFHIAKADEALHPGEEGFLRQVAQRFGFSETEFSRIKARHVPGTARNPYEVLGVEPSISDDELKRHYRKLLADSQPDQLVARGVPKEFAAIATGKLAAINEAYDALAKERSL
jgi:DnaJ like chaperone protein